jgi:hypothetical protein
MSRKPTKFTQAEIARAMRVAEANPPRVVEITPDGTIRIVPYEKETPSTKIPVQENAGFIL